VAPHIPPYTGEVPDNIESLLDIPRAG
jgi:hypothetical protein